MFWAGVIVGLVVGIPLGIFVSYMMLSAKRSQDELDRAVSEMEERDDERVKRRPDRLPVF